MDVQYDNYISPIQQIQGDKHFQQELLNNEVVIVYVSASWCQPCKIFSPKFEEIAYSCKNSNIKFLKDDISRGASEPNESGNLSVHLNKVTGVPAYILYIRGNLHKKITGGHPEQILEILSQLEINF